MISWLLTIQFVNLYMYFQNQFGFRTERCTLLWTICLEIIYYICLENGADVCGNMYSIFSWCFQILWCRRPRSTTSGEVIFQHKTSGIQECSNVVQLGRLPAMINPIVVSPTITCGVPDKGQHQASQASLIYSVFKILPHIQFVVYIN